MSAVHDALAQNFAAQLAQRGETVTLKPEAGGEYPLVAMVLEHGRGRQPAEVPGEARNERAVWYTLRLLSDAGLVAVGQPADGRPTPAYPDTLALGGIEATVRHVQPVGRPAVMYIMYAMADVRSGR